MLFAISSTSYPLIRKECLISVGGFDPMMQSAQDYDVWLRLAEKYDLPDVITDFIRTHHGKGIAKFFYVQYKNKHPEEDVDIEQFTYPGPNPQTREQAIIMMTDTVEAATKSLPVYSDETISKKVDELIDNQVKAGYFEECPITFRDIAIAKIVLAEKLKSIYHTRITYPKLINE